MTRRRASSTVLAGLPLAIALLCLSPAAAQDAALEKPFLDRVKDLLFSVTPGNVHVLGECGNISIDYPGATYSIQGCVLDDGYRIGILEAYGAGVLALPGASATRSAVLCNASDIWGCAGPQICATLGGSWKLGTAAGTACFTVKDQYGLSQRPLDAQLTKLPAVLADFPDSLTGTWSVGIQIGVGVSPKPVGGNVQAGYAFVQQLFPYPSFLAPLLAKAPGSSLPQWAWNPVPPPTPPPAPPPPPPPPVPPSGPFKVMAVGDSITHSENGHHSWRFHLYNHLVRNGVRADFVGPWNRPHGDGSYAVEGWDADHYARWGCIGDSLLSPQRYLDPCDPGHTFGDRIAFYKPDILLIHLGTNDMTYITDAAGMRDTLRRFIAVARQQKPDIQIILAQVGQVSLFGNRLVASEFAPLVAELARQETRPGSKVEVAPVHALWSMATDTDSGGTHPNARGELVIAKAFADTLYFDFNVGRGFGSLPPATPGPPKVENISISPSTLVATQPFTVSWPRVVNPGIWTMYQVQVRFHQKFGFKLVWESPVTTDLSVRYDGPPLPQAGVYHVVVNSIDLAHPPRMSEPVELTVTDGPPSVTGIALDPPSITRAQPFTVTWPRVVNPGVWTTYKVQVRYHQKYGFGVIWESPPTPNLSVTYDGPELPQAGVYHIVVVSTDGKKDTPSNPAPLEVSEGPPRVTGISVDPPSITRGHPFTVRWPRVLNPGIWTTYKVTLRYHPSYGHKLVWESPVTPDLSVTYGGPPLPQAGVYELVVSSLDGARQTDSVPVYLEVADGPPKVTSIAVQPTKITRSQPFTVTWPRVVNPGIWTTYKVQVRHHQTYGFGVIWESAPTPNLSVTYDGPALPQAGAYHITVVSIDGEDDSPSEPALLSVHPDGVPKVEGVTIDPPFIGLGSSFTVSWPRVNNPGVWTTYRVEVHNHASYGFGLVWRSADTTGLSMSYTGPRLDPGVYHIVVYSMDGKGQASSDIVPFSVYGPALP